MKVNKITVTFLFAIWIPLTLMAQPGPPPPINLNNYAGHSNAIIIDSTSDLKKIETLRNNSWYSSLELHLRLAEIPKEFAGFTHIKYLNINCGTELKDLSGLNYFPNLQFLSIWDYEGNKIGNTMLILDSLQSLRISRCKALTDIHSLTELQALKQLEIYNCPALQLFPKWKEPNQLNTVKLENGSGFQYWDSQSERKSNLDISNLRFLDKLEYIQLGSYSCFQEIPDCFPKSITRIHFIGKGYHDARDKIELKNLDNLNLYPNLKDFSLHSVCLEKINGNFKKLSLTTLRLHSIFNLSDISGIFTFKSIDHLKISQCQYIEQIKSIDRNCRINFMDLENLSRLQNIYFLFRCKNIRQLEIREASPALFIPELKRMDRIPTILLYASGRGYHLYKKDGTWEKTK